MAYVDLWERRGEGRRRDAGQPWRGLIKDPYVLLVAGLILVIPAVAASYTVLVQGPPVSCVAFGCVLPPRHALVVGCATLLAASQAASRGELRGRENVAAGDSRCGRGNHARRGCAEDPAYG